MVSAAFGSPPSCSISIVRDAGSNSHQISTTAVRNGEDYVLNGTSGVDEAGALIVVACTGRDESSGAARVSLLLVPTDTPGLVKHPLPVGISLPEKQYTLHFDNARLPADSLIGVEDEGFRQVFDGLNPERITGAAVCVGIGRFAVERGAAYAHQIGVGNGHRRLPRDFASAGQGQNRGRPRGADDREGGMAVRERRTRR
jgi:alkylation response protein AidB-like acyl-CoA dehydrogenase